jgi:hypothetical protein
LKKIQELEKNKRLTMVGMLSSSHNDFEKNLTRVKLQVQLSQQTKTRSEILQWVKRSITTDTQMG